MIKYVFTINKYSNITIDEDGKIGSECNPIKEMEEMGIDVSYKFPEKQKGEKERDYWKRFGREKQERTKKLANIFHTRNYLKYLRRQEKYGVDNIGIFPI